MLDFGIKLRGAEMEVIRIDKDTITMLNRYVKNNGGKYEVRTILDKTIYVQEVR